MPSESSFKKQAALVQDLLKNFTAVQYLKSTVVLKAAISELIDSTIAFNHFIPFFLAHPLFQEIPPAVFHVLEKFLHKNPNFDMPSGYAKIVKLDARVRDSLTPSKGMSPFFLCLGILSYLFYFISDTVAPTGPRVDKNKKGKLAVRLLMLLFIISILTYFFLE